MGDTSMLYRLSMTSALPASWRAVISLLHCKVKISSYVVDLCIELPCPQLAPSVY